MYQWINLYECLQERLISCIDLYVSVHVRDQFYVSMDKSIQVFTRKSNSMYQWINLYECLQERLILYKCSRERVILCING